MREIKRIRADLGHEHESAVYLNALWARTRKVFKKRGYTL